MEVKVVSACVKSSNRVTSNFITSASKKSLNFFDDDDEESCNEWQKKEVKKWSRKDIMHWVVSVASKIGLSCEELTLSGFRKVNDGLTLSALTLHDFLGWEHNYGHKFYYALRELMEFRQPVKDTYSENGFQYACPGFNTKFQSVVVNQCPNLLATRQVPQFKNDGLQCDVSFSGVEHEDESLEVKTKGEKKGVGRPPKDQKELAIMKLKGGLHNISESTRISQSSPCVDQNLDLAVDSSCVKSSNRVTSNFITSASKKCLNFFDDDDEESCNEWQKKEVKKWYLKDIMHWIIAVASKIGLCYEDLSLSGFREVNNGLTLSALTLDDFLGWEHTYGHKFYYALQELMAFRHPDKDTYSENGFKKACPGFNTSFQSYAGNQFPDILAPRQVPQLNFNNDNLQSDKSFSGGDSRGESQEVKAKVKRKCGRPPKYPKDQVNRTRRRRKSGQKCGRVWEFIRDLLKSQKYKDDIRWEDEKQGMFKIVNSERVAKLWGKIRNNPNMNYEKLSRAMRYYYKSHVFRPVIGKRLIYKFGANATNWRPNDPIFSSEMIPSNQ